jgi:hypothetical protein
MTEESKKEAMAVAEEQLKSEPKKKGRPKSKHYVKESELRDEIAATKAIAAQNLMDLEAEWDSKISEAKMTAEKEKLMAEKEEAIAVANTKTHCTPRLGEIIVLTVDRVATQTKFRHYTYLDDMKAEATYQSIRGIVKFSLDKKNAAGQMSSSFSYLTQIITNAFRQILNKEKRNREIKDQAIEMAMDFHSDIEINFESSRRRKERLSTEN